MLEKIYFTNDQTKLLFEKFDNRNAYLKFERDLSTLPAEIYNGAS